MADVVLHDTANNVVKVAYPPIDGSGRTAQAMFTAEHVRLHASTMFICSYYNASLANAGTVDLAIATGAIETHTVVNITTGGDSTVDLHSGAVWTGGTPLTAHNRRLKNDGIPPYIPTCSFLINPTISNTGSVISTRYFAGGRGGNANGVVSGNEYDEELIFPINTSSYFFRITNIAGTAQPVNIFVDFYEFTIPY